MYFATKSYNVDPYIPDSTVVDTLPNPGPVSWYAQYLIELAKRQALELVVDSLEARIEYLEENGGGGPDSTYYYKNLYQNLLTEVTSLETQISDLEVQLSNYDALISIQNILIDSLEIQLAEKNLLIDSLNNLLTEKDLLIDSLLSLPPAGDVDPNWLGIDSLLRMQNLKLD